LFLRGHKLLPLSEPRLLPLRTLFAVDHSSPYYNEKDKANVFYAQSWALVHYLISGNKGQRNRQMVRFVELINNGKPTEAAFNEAFQTNYETLEKELKEYITRDTYPAHIVTFEKKLVRESEMRSTPLSEAEAQTYLGDLLLHSQRVEAESYLQNALKLDPQLAMANASMGLLRVRQGRFEEARAYLEKAVAANSENYLAHYYYAFALSRQGMDANNIVYRYAPESLATMRRELNKAIALAPQFAESYHLLAFINLVAGEQLDESIGFLKKALALSPGKSEYTFALIQIHLSRQEFKAARQLLEPLAREGEDPDMRRRAQSLLDSLTGLEEREARRKTAESNSAAAGKSKLPGQTQESREVEYDPLADLGEALRKPASGEVRVQGSLVGIDCGPKMIVLTIKTADRMVKVQTAGFEKMGFSTFTETVDREITCGLRKSPEWVVVTYKPTTEARTKNAGTAVALEFVPKEFKLKP
jgi:tetratricopeptide (TPR) repeat protein